MPLLQRLRSIFPPEISGVVIFMVGMSAGLAGLRSLLGVQANPVAPAEWSVGGITLSTMVALNVWGRGIVRMLCTLLGLLAGYAAAGLAGLVGGNEMAVVAHARTFGLPDFGTVSWSFYIGLAVPFAIASVAAAMKAVGTITVCQRTNDMDWVRPDMRSITRGVLADGASTALAGLAGAVGTNTCTPSVGLAAATGVASRQVAYAVGALFLLLGFFPKLPAALAVMPRAVIVAALLFAVSYIIINGLQVMTSRMLDARRTLVIGLSIIAGVAVEVFPTLAASAPKALAPLLASSLVFSTVIALGLNLLFRLGVRRTLTLELDLSRWKVFATRRRVAQTGCDLGRSRRGHRPRFLGHRAGHRCGGGELLARGTARDRGQLRRVQPRGGHHLSGRGAGVSGATPHRRRDTRKRRRGAPAGGIHAAAHRGPGTFGEEGSNGAPAVSFRSLTRSQSADRGPNGLFQSAAVSLRSVTLTRRFVEAGGGSLTLLIRWRRRRRRRSAIILATQEKAECGLVKSRSEAMKTFIIVVVSLIVGALIGGFLGFGGGAMGGAAGGLIIGTQTGVCVAADAATQAGLIPADKANELVAKSIERIRSSPKAQPVANSPQIKWVASTQDCDQLRAEFAKPDK